MTARILTTLIAVPIILACVYYGGIPFLVMILIPLFTYAIYPALNRMWPLTPGPPRPWSSTNFGRRIGIFS